MERTDVYSKRNSVSSSIGEAILLYIILFSLSWIILFTFNPQMVSYADSTKGADPAKCLIASLIIALVICIIIWLFMRSC